MKGFIFISIIIILLIGCIGSYQVIIIDDIHYQSAPRDPITINNIQLHKDILRFNISYGGGCKEHEFQLIATSFMETILRNGVLRFQIIVRYIIQIYMMVLI